MAWRGQQHDIPIDWSPTTLLQGVTGVLEALVVLLCALVHYATFGVLRRSGLDTPCSCRRRFGKHLMPTIEDFIGLKEDCRTDHFDSSSKEAALGALDTTPGRIPRISMADSGYEAGGDDSQSCYSSPTGDLKGREQQDIDNDQDSKDRELFEALQSERETLAALYSELEQERNCSATAASEALAMISRLQEEKAAVQLEARQFQRMVLEKAMYDQEAVEALNELLVRREDEKVALEEEIRVCRERLDSVMREEREERRHSLGRVLLNSEPPISVKNEKINASARAGNDDQPKCVDKFSTTKSQLLTAFVHDGGREFEAEFEKTQLGLRSTSIRNKGGIKSEVERDEGKPEETGFVSLRRKWGAQDVSLKTLDQVKEDRRIEEKRLSVLEYVWKFEEQLQQQGGRPRVQVSRPKSAGDSRSKTCSDDVHESTGSMTSRKDEPTSRVLTRDDSLRRRLFEEEDSSEEQNLNGSSASEEAEDGGSCGGEEGPRPSCISAYDKEVMDGEVCRDVDGTWECTAEEALFVHDVYEVQKSPCEVSGSVMGHAGSSLQSLSDAETQQPLSDRLGKPDLHTFETEEEKEYESEQETLCLIHPAHLHQEVDEPEKDTQQWEDLQGRVRYKSLRISPSLRMDNSRSRVEEEVEQLTHRLKALEADRYLMKQTIESLRRENGEMKLLQDLAHQLLELRGMEQQELWPKSRTPITLQFQGMMSFTRLRTTAQAHLNKLAQACLKGADTSAPQGLGRLLQQSPKGLPGTCLTRVRKVEEIFPSTALSREKEKWPF